MKAHLIPMRGGDEQDAFGRRSKRLLCVFRKPHIRQWWKRHYSRRQRRAGRMEVRRCA